MDFILEEYDTLYQKPTSEFRLSKSTIERDLNFVALEAFYGHRKDAKETQKKYIKMKRTLANVAKRNYVNNFPNANIQKAVSN